LAVEPITPRSSRPGIASAFRNRLRAEAIERVAHWMHILQNGTGERKRRYTPIRPDGDVTPFVPYHHQRQRAQPNRPTIFLVFVF
jgi:hypothetical protein